MSPDSAPSGEEAAAHRQWAHGPPNTLLNALHQAGLTSTVDSAGEHRLLTTGSAEWRRWAVQVNNQTSGNIWHTDLSKLSDLELEEEEEEEEEQEQEEEDDDSDVEMDEKRLEPRSDDDDTWVNTSSCSLKLLVCWDILACYVLLLMKPFWKEWASFVFSFVIITVRILCEIVDWWF